MEETFDPYPEQISIHGNKLSGGGAKPDGFDLKALKTMMFGLKGSFPDVLWDGYVNVDIADPKICIDQDGVEILNADMPNKNKNPRVEDIFKCQLEKLAPVKLVHNG